MVRKSTTKQQDAPASTPSVEPGGVFISHVHEDEALAKAFALLIENVTAGVVPTYRSTAKQFGGGIQYGEEWFRWICESVKKASHIVALLTPTSISRPWILFEAGLGKAEPSSVVFGVGLGISREDSYKGPFAALQNCGCEEPELIKLCKELLEGTPAKPNDKMIARCVAEFRSAVDAHFASVKPGRKQAEDPTDVAVFQALEEMKLMLRDQSRLFEMDSPRLIRRDRDVERLFFDMPMSLEEMEPELGLVFASALATQMGHGWVQPLAEHVMKLQPSSAEDRVGSVVFVVHRLCRNLMRRTKGDDIILHEVERAFERYARWQVERSSRVLAPLPMKNRTRQVKPGSS